jgi:prepilin-type N-terminal cleavage/methylation domain-containing protein
MKAAVRSSSRFPRHGRRQRGFTLLELILAVTLLATYLLPMILIISQAKARAIKYTLQREVRDFAQRKLFDRIHYYETNDAGDFSAEGHPSWTWRVSPPEMVGQGEQVLLQYTIDVELPQKLDGASPGDTEGAGSVYQTSLWAFPDARWYEEQQALYDQGLYSPFYGDPALGGNY